MIQNDVRFGVVEASLPARPVPRARLIEQPRSVHLDFSINILHSSLIPRPILLHKGCIVRVEHVVVRPDHRPHMVRIAILLQQRRSSFRKRAIWILVVKHDLQCILHALEISSADKS